MRKLTYYIATSIDGYIAAPDGTVDAFTVVGDHMSTIATDYPETLPKHVWPHFGVDAQATGTKFDTILMGRKTLQPALDVGLTNAYPHLRTIVFSRSLQLDDPTVTVTAEDPVAVVADLKREDGLGIWLCGGGTLASALVAEIDELIVKTYPVLLGAGIPMFVGGEYTPAEFEPTETKVHENGVVFSRYRRR
ncbi:dihydrofolate reductase [Antrihabitans sp. YC3-6]|uniref:Dihydrofolate reductase n=1 Tax=Antrihabitans stalagmiti TaxID=2799499 RepID=A0A934NW03_9NOCA|nr:dihydrofolate reductase family protein [Antrihabitans stalagmiti]MBJ8342598.1 dihydrofolate reductase [Antrihabitans stalagmiti]